MVKDKYVKVKYNLVDILVIIILVILTGHNDFEERIFRAFIQIMMNFLVLIY